MALRRFPVLFAASLALAAALAGCARAPVRPDPPQVTLMDVGITDATLFAQRYRIDLRVQNPNPFALPVEGMAYEVWINEQLFASGVSSRRVTIPAYGAERLELEAVGTLAGLFRQLTALERSLGGGLGYRVEGTVRIAGREEPIPFAQRGEVSLLPEEGGTRSEGR